MSEIKAPDCSGFQLDRAGSVVTFTLKCRDDYAAMLMADRIWKHLKEGGRFEVVMTGIVIEGQPQ